METDILKRLSEASGVSGFEGDVREIIKKEISKYADKLTEDNLGNLIAFKKGKGTNKKKIALMAHMDEVGLLVKRVNKGFIDFTKIGGIDDRILMTQRVVIKSKTDIEGIIGSKPIHLQKEDDKKKVMKYDELYIDIGTVGKKKVDIEKGTPISFKSEFKKLQDNIFTGKSFDNRVGVYCLIDLIKRIKNHFHDLYFVFSTQEEVGLKGARTSTYSIEPDLAIVVDTTIAGDVPAVNDKESEIKLGDGTSVTLVEAGGSGTILPESLKKYIFDVAKRNKLKYQLEIIEGGMTDAAVVQLIKHGILSCSLGVPVRNIHTPNEIVDVQDIENTVKLIECMITNWK